MGRAERTCQADGTWSPKDLPTCVRKWRSEDPPEDLPEDLNEDLTTVSAGYQNTDLPETQV